MADPINSMLLLAGQAEAQARRFNNVSLYEHASQVKRLALALQKVQELISNSSYSQVDIKLYCYSEVIDFEVIGHDEWGNPSDITSDLGASSFVEALKEIAHNIEKEEVSNG